MNTHNLSAPTLLEGKRAGDPSASSPERLSMDGRHEVHAGGSNPSSGPISNLAGSDKFREALIDKFEAIETRLAYLEAKIDFINSEEPREQK